MTPSATAKSLLKFFADSSWLLLTLWIVAVDIFRRDFRKGCFSSPRLRSSCGLQFFWWGPLVRPSKICLSDQTLTTLKTDDTTSKEKILQTLIIVTHSKWPCPKIGYPQIPWLLSRYPHLKKCNFKPPSHPPCVQGSCAQEPRWMPSHGPRNSFWTNCCCRSVPSLPPLAANCASRNVSLRAGLCR